MESMPKINIDEVEATEFGDGGKFEARLLRIAHRIGAQKLGYNITILPAGKCAFPFHRHHANEEMFFILEGEGSLRYGEQTFPLRQGDFVACPPGSGGGHQVINSSENELRYLAVSTNQSPEVCEYPDSRKVGSYAGDFADPEAGLELNLVTKSESAVKYFEGEGD